MPNVRVGSFFAAHRKLLSVRYVPEAAVCNIKLNVSYRDVAWSGRNKILKFEICRSDRQ